MSVGAALPGGGCVSIRLFPLVALALSGCGGTPAPGPITGTLDRDRCLLSAAPSSGGGGPIAFALTDSIDRAHAPEGRNDSERFLFRNLYETLLTVDCTGRTVPGLAESWAPSRDGATWVFVLRDDARFSDGSLLLADHVVRSWNARRLLSGAAPGSPWAILSPRLASIEPSGRRIVRIVLKRPWRELPLLLAHPAFAITGSRPPGKWPAGSGPFRIVPGGGEGETVRLEPNRYHPERPETSILLLLRPDGDARDLLAEGVDAVVVRRRAASGYGATLPDVVDFALPFDRNYLLLWRDGHGDPFAGTVPREEFARYVAVADAKPSRSVLFAQRHDGDCGAPDNALPPVRPRGRGGAARIVYDKSDDDAKNLAGRITALVRAASGSEGVIAAGLAPERFRAALPAGRDAGYIFPLAHAFADPCLLAEALAAAAPWTVGGRHGGGGTEEALAAGGHVFPLVLTRPHLLARRSLAGLATDHGGTILLQRAGRRTAEVFP